MAVLVLSPAEQTAAMLAGTSELKYLLARENVSTKIQALFYHVGAVTLARFSTFASSEAELKEVLKDNMGLDSSTSLAIRGEVSGVLAAWSSSRDRTSELSRLQGTMDATRQNKPLLGSEYLMMKRSFEQLYGVRDDADTPARVYLREAHFRDGGG